MTNPSLETGESGTPDSHGSDSAPAAANGKPAQQGPGATNGPPNLGGGSPLPPLLNLTPQQQAALAQAKERVGLLGQIVWLLMQSPPHKHLFLADLEWLVMPALQLGQFRLWQAMGTPQAYASWAFLDEAAEARLKQNIKTLAPADWKSGEALWLIDMVAPFGGAEAALKELREQVLKGKRIKSLQPAPGGGVAVMAW